MCLPRPDRGRRAVGIWHAGGQHGQHGNNIDCSLADGGMLSRVADRHGPFCLLSCESAHLCMEDIARKDACKDQAGLVLERSNIYGRYSYNGT